MYFLIHDELMGDLIDWCSDNDCTPHQIPESLYWMKFYQGYPFCFVFLNDVVEVFDMFLVDGINIIKATQGYNENEGNFLMDFSYN